MGVKLMSFYGLGIRFAVIKVKVFIRRIFMCVCYIVVILIRFFGCLCIGFLYVSLMEKVIFREVILLFI